MAKNIIIISNGRFGDASFLQKKLLKIPDRMIICCDGAARHLIKIKIRPDIVLGDMDSLEVSRLAALSDEGIKIIEYPARKDFTDTELALDYALNLKPAAIYIWGALGGRIDHILANVFLLKKAKDAGINAGLIDEYGEAFIARGVDAINDAVGCTVSLLALSPEVCGISLAGFAYPLDNETLSMGQTRGVSNRIKDSPAVIQCKTGTLLIIRYWQKDFFPEAKQ